MSQQFTKSQVATTGSTKDNALIILHDKVYNVTNFLNEHPGGEEILLDHAGKDGSEDFDDVGHSQDAFDLMKKYVVGELHESERTNKTPKQGWTTSSITTKSTEKKEEQGMSQTTMIAVGLVVLAIVYYVFL
ncbi:cytochrome b5-like [Hylaeus anthracinus]|uniref:cytochrome b5-like n=1 Tax=Hylaeus anthracinus TaxID=313031 RepID=UPI0023B96204|nr:cytochrome b5-like [Hylaeus anthracinus]